MKTKSLFSLMILLGLLAGGFWPSTAQESQPAEAWPNQAVRPQLLPGPIPADPYRPGRVLVKFQAGTSVSSLVDAPSRYGATYLESLDGLDVQVWQVPEGQELAVVEQLNADPLVEYAEPDYVYDALGTPNDPHWSKQWAHTKIKSASAWDISTGSATVTVAIVDTGIDETHPDLASKIVAGKDYVDGDSDPHDLQGHGTHVAGIAAAVTNNGVGIAGLDWQARIMPVRVLDDQGYGYSSDITSGINWAYQHGADVINLSLGGSGYSQSMQDAVNNAHAAGSLVVAAMGNCRTYDPPYCPVANPTEYPAAYDNVMAVAATGPSDGYAYYSQYGPHCDIAAPGGAMSYLQDPNGIYSTLPTYWVDLNDYGYLLNYDYLQGTSMASPYVAGLAALVWSVDPTLTPDRVQGIIQDHAVDLGAPGWDANYGWGRIDASAALWAAVPIPAAPTLSPIDNPENDGTYLVDWSDVADAIGYKLQEDGDPAFASPTVVYSGPSSQLAVSGKGPGTWYYRVLASNVWRDGPWSVAVSTTVSAPPGAPTLDPISNPANGDAYLLSWSAVAAAAGYRLEEATNPSFTGSVIRYAGAALEFQVTGQPNGTWYYRVLAYNSAGDGPWSLTRSTVVNVVALPAPTLDPISNADGDGQFTVTWSAVAGASSYTLEQSRSPYFEAAGEVFSGGATQYPVVDQPGGIWYYRVRAFGSGGARSPWSSQRSTTVTAWVFLPLLARNLSPTTGYGLPIDEGFEGGVVPPAGWTRNQTNLVTWRILPFGSFEGSYHASCPWDDVSPQDEVLLSPEFVATSAQLQFHSKGSLVFCRDVLDDCDLNVWLVVGAWDGGADDDIFVYQVDADWTGEMAWSPSTIALTPYLPAGTPVRVAFQYQGFDGYDVGLDAIHITGQ